MSREVDEYFEEDEPYASKDHNPGLGKRLLNRIAKSLTTEKPPKISCPYCTGTRRQGKPESHTSSCTL